MSTKYLSHLQENMIKKWQKHTPPVRPSKGMVALYEKGVLTETKKKPATDWGVLGCTPEIRSLAGKYQVEITCIDHNPDAFHAYKTICKPSKYEKFKCSDWLDLNLHKMFDIALGDGAMSMLPLKNHVIFLANIHKMLKSKGLALLRIHVIAPPVFDSPQQVFEWYRRNKANTPVYSTTRSYLYALWLEPDTMKLSNIEFLTKVQELYRDGIITDAEYEGLNDIKNCKVTIQYTTKELFEKLISSYFEIESVNYAEDYPLHTNHPIYFLRKK
jgi:hypothetical protein